MKAGDLIFSESMACAFLDSQRIADADDCRRNRNLLPGDVITDSVVVWLDPGTPMILLSDPVHSEQGHWWCKVLVRDRVFSVRQTVFA